MRDSPHRRAALRAIAAVGNQVPFERTNSIGVARFDPQLPLSLGELMAKADQDMYKHKSRRDCANSSQKH